MTLKTWDQIYALVLLNFVLVKIIDSNTDGDKAVSKMYRDRNLL